MTTKPKPKKFRIRKASPLAAATDEAPERDSTDAPANTTDSPVEGAPERRPAPEVRVERRAQPRAQEQEPADVGAQAPDTAFAPRAVATDKTKDIGPTDLSAIRREGLTGRQLRMARRLAQKHGISVTSDFDAVRQLRQRGIDPFERANMLELVVPETAAVVDTGKIQLPETVRPGASPPAERVDAPPRPEDRSSQIAQIKDIQRDIARRRRRKLMLLFARLAFFVGLPTFLAGYYYFNIATPMYATKTEFVIQQAEGSGQSALGGLFSGTGLATSQDSITVQSYLTSRDAMLRLDEDAGFKSHFSQDFIDPIQRLPEDATNEAAYELYADKVQIGYDPTEGIVKMEVIAASPETSEEYARLLVDYAEQRVDELTQRLREDQMTGARESFAEAEQKMLDAQNRVLELQEQLGVLDPAAESGAVMSQIASFETQLRQKRLELDQLQSNRRPNEARVAGVQGDINRLQGVVDELRAEMTDGSSGVASLARVSAELRIAETDLQTRTALVQQALQQLETARIEANRQVRYLSLGVTPVAPDEATYPRSFENTLLAFLIFSGIYLMMSLTASILREQVSA